MFCYMSGACLLTEVMCVLLTEWCVLNNMSYTCLSS